MQVEENNSEYSLNKSFDSDEDDGFPKDLMKYLRDIITKEEYVDYSVEKRSINTGGGNYFSILYEFNVKGRTVQKEKETNIFIKYIIPSKQDFFSIREAFLKERFAYRDLFQTIKDFEEKANVPREEIFNIANSYESPPEAIILDNLEKKGFTTPHRMDPMSLRFAQMSIEQLAKFHGSSFVLQKLRPDYFNQKVKVINYPINFTEKWKTFYNNQIDLMSHYLSEVRMKIIRARVPEFIDKIFKYGNEKTIPGCVLCHGDYRPSNVLIKESNGELTEVVPIDFQLLYYGCPINDFMYLMISGSDGNLRRKHMNDLKDLYFDSLDKYVSYFGLNIENIYPRKEFERQFQERLDYGLMIMVFLLSFMFTTDSDAPDVGNVELSNLKFTVDSRYKQRLEEIIEDYEEWGIL